MLVRVFCSDGMTDLEGVVDDAEDFDGVFTLREDDGTLLRVNGWQMVEFDIVGVA